MISYKPLWHTLIEKNTKKMELVKLIGMSSGTLSKLNKDEPVALTVLERICLALDCPIEAVVEIKGRGEIGIPIPSAEDVTETDGGKLADKTGREWDAELVKVNEALGGGYELCHVQEKRSRKKKDPDA